ncbi:hypothetical protein [Pseudomonas orientalis]|uniref:AbiV family abortive infection protein n=1 Tax=Pseudomonas orientalis TaxID=76758 RepID=A0A4Q7D503_9PSED|nr:hypothetical protein [Pseudomonas orientalis]RZI33142.1 hypothetical protein EUX57_03880 [Pseudomonas orientalis]
MNPQTFLALSTLNDLKSAAYDALAKRHKMPALLLFYSFIDICATLAKEGEKKTSNQDRFKNYLVKYHYSKWSLYTPYDLWAARCSLLHAYSPLGDHSTKASPPKTIFYYSWPEKKEVVHAAIAARGYENFYLMNTNDIKIIAIDCFNSLWRRVETDEVFELQFRSNAAHLLRDFNYIQLENELTFIEQLKDIP